jgi:hypothetical protein
MGNASMRVEDVQPVVGGELIHGIKTYIINSKNHVRVSCGVSRSFGLCEKSRCCSFECRMAFEEGLAGTVDHHVTGSRHRKRESGFDLECRFWKETSKRLRREVTRFSDLLLRLAKNEVVEAEAEAETEAIVPATKPTTAAPRASKRRVLATRLGRRKQVRPRRAPAS